MPDWFHSHLFAALDGDKRSVLFFIALYCLLICTWSLIHQLRMRRWTPAAGRLILADVVLMSPGAPSDRLYRANALYEFAVNGELIQGSKVSAWQIVTNHNARFLLGMQLGRISHDPNGALRVYYNPRKPSKSVLILPGPIGLVVTAAIAWVPMVLWLINYESVAGR